VIGRKLVFYILLIFFSFSLATDISAKKCEEGLCGDCYQGQCLCTGIMECPAEKSCPPHSLVQGADTWLGCGTFPLPTNAPDCPPGTYG
jgi:hypothetical protein